MKNKKWLRTATQARGELLGKRGLLVLLVLALRPLSSEAETLRIGVLDSTRHGSGVTATSPSNDDLRASLSRNIEELGFESFEFVTFSRLEPDLIERVDLLVLHSASELSAPMRGPLSSEEQKALRGFVEAGGDVFIPADASVPNPAIVDACNSLLAPFGARIDRFASMSTPFGSIEAAHPVIDGPFGRVTSVRLGEIRNLTSWLVQIGPFASTVVTAQPGGQAVFAVIEAGALAPGSGRVVMTSEANWCVDSDINDGYFRENETLFLNSMAWLTADTSSCGTRCTALDEYVAAPDDNYRYSLVRTLTGRPGYTEYHLDMISQKWRDESEVDRTLWEHRLIIVVPDTVSSPVALLGIVDGFNGQDLEALEFEREWAVNTNTVVASVRQVPNQPLGFSGKEGLSIDDAILAHTFARYLDTGDETWPALLPMVKSAVRAMDTTQTFLAEDEAHAVEIDSFVVAGPGMRGWTSWLTAAVDQRVRGIIPVRYESLNIEAQLEHQREVYKGVTERIVGGYTEAVLDYVNENVIDRFPTPEGQALLKIIDPYEYRERLTMPKLLINSAGDEFFVSDSAQFYVHDLVGPTYLRYVPNTGHHSLPVELWTAQFESFYTAVVHDEPLPRFSWSVEPDGTIRVKADTMPIAVRQWQATNTEHRDFRMDTFGPQWTSAPLEDQGDGAYAGRVAQPSRGHTAHFVELDFPSSGPVPHTFTTEIVVVSAEKSFRRGDCNDDGRVDISDALCAFEWLFLGSEAPGCLAALNTNGDWNVDIADPVHLLEFAFSGGSAPAEPFPACGPGPLPTDKTMGCETTESCSR